MRLWIMLFCSRDGWVGGESFGDPGEGGGCELFFLFRSNANVDYAVNVGVMMGSGVVGYVSM